MPGTTLVAPYEFGSPEHAEWLGGRIQGYGEAEAYVGEPLDLLERLSAECEAALAEDASPWSVGWNSALEEGLRDEHARQNGTHVVWGSGW